MNIFKFITNLFKRKKKTIPAEHKVYPATPTESVKHLTEIDGELFEIEHPIDVPKDYPAVVTTSNEPPIDAKPRRKSLKELQARVPKRETRLATTPPTGTATKVFVSPEFDYTPNPGKYWRKFKRGKKVYWKKFYHPEIV